MNAAHLKRDRCLPERGWSVAGEMNEPSTQIGVVTQRDERSYCPSIMSAPPTGSPHSSPTANLRVNCTESSALL